RAGRSHQCIVINTDDADIVIFNDGQHVAKFTGIFSLSRHRLLMRQYVKVVPLRDRYCWRRSRELAAVRRTRVIRLRCALGARWRQAG
ncbi:hypothetical protein ACJH6H_28515, partial [Mycobacterium sp. SMC-21]|uniref:hypothetical protein n=1 Tax=Mycobacterium sp. SMC-21 TaxID=3381632 RepID=UPI003875E107